MRAYRVLMVMLVVALLLGISLGCGEKKVPDTGQRPEGEIAEVPEEGEAMFPGGEEELPPMPGEEEGLPLPMAGTADLVAEAMAAKRAGRLEQAELKFQAALLEEPDSEDAHWGLAWTLADLRRKAEAIREFEKVLELTADPERQSEAEAAIARLQ